MVYFTIFDTSRLADLVVLRAVMSLLSIHLKGSLRVVECKPLLVPWYKLEQILIPPLSPY